MSRLINTFLLMLLACAGLMIGLGIFVIIIFSQLTSRTGVIIHDNYDSIRFMDDALRAVDKEERYLLESMVLPAGDGLDLAQITSFRKQFFTALDYEENNLTVPGEAEAARNLRDSYELFAASADHFLKQKGLPVVETTSSTRASFAAVDSAAKGVRRAAYSIRTLNHENMQLEGSRPWHAAPGLVFAGIFGCMLILLGAGLVLGRRLRRQAMELQALRTHFLAIASHELRTPVTSLRMGLDIIKSNTLGELNDEQHGVVSSCMDDCDRLLNLSRQLLDVTKSQSGQLEVYQTSADINGIISDSVASLQTIIREHRVTVQLDLDSVHPLLVQADPMKVGWVLSNVLANAFRYAPSGSEVKITVRQRKKEAVVSVSDRGPGIPQQIVRKVFTPYYQAQSNTRGTVGLGLSISQEIVAAHGGRIWVETQPFLGEGTTISFSLPVAEKVQDY